MRRIPLAVTALALMLFQVMAPAEEVQLLEAGSAPRETLRYSFQTGRSERVSMTTDMSMRVSLGGQQMPLTDVPAIQLVLALKVASVDAAGTARLEFEVVSASAGESTAEGAAQIGEALGAVQGLKGWYAMDARGRITGGALDSRGAANAAQLMGDFQESMQQLSAPFPAEAVGQGARWRVQQNTDTGGMKISQTAQYSLRARSGQRVVLDASIVDSKIDPGTALPMGARIESLKIEGGGATTIELDKLAPNALMDINTQIGMAMEAQGQSQSMGMDMKIRQTIAPEG